MAPSGRQRTFELVPIALGFGQQQPGNDVQPGNDAQPIYSKPPMTTKQAKKLHNQRNKGPKLSKAERRRIELMEQDRIRKEFEKEKAQARARTARDKKRAKEEKEKEERKKKGLPLVDIHPSQDTISRFISRLGTVRGAQRDSTSADALDIIREDGYDTTIGAEDDEHDESDKENEESVTSSWPERQAKKTRLSRADEQVADRVSPVSSQHRPDPLATISLKLRAESNSRASSVDSDESSQMQSKKQLIADVAPVSSRKVANPDLTEQCPSASLVENCPAPHTVAWPPAPKELSAGLQPPQRSTTPLKKDLPPPNAGATSRVPSHLGDGAFKKPTSPYITALRPGLAIKPPYFKVPSAPPKFKSPAAQLKQSAERPRFLSRQSDTGQRRQPSLAHQRPRLSVAHNLPTSTQAFLHDHADEIFPSPTQEARELCETFLPGTSKPSINGPTIRSEASINQTLIRPTYECLGIRPTPQVPSAARAEDYFDSSCLSTQDFVFSTQDVVDIETPSKVWPASAARPLLPAVNEEVQDYIEQPRASADGGARGNNLVACCPCAGISGSDRFQGHKSSCSAMRNGISSQMTRREQDDDPTAASLPLRSSRLRHTSVVQQLNTTDSICDNHTTSHAPQPLTTSNNPAPKKRMFGSSGPGPEGLVAMERSYQEMLRQERAREAQLRAQERLVAPVNVSVDEPGIDLVEFELMDDLLDDDLDESVGKGSSRRSSGAAQRDLEVQPLATKQITIPLVYSQETDYGDIDCDEFDLLKGDTSWLDEDLDDI